MTIHFETDYSDKARAWFIGTDTGYKHTQTASIYVPVFDPFYHVYTSDARNLRKCRKFRTFASAWRFALARTLGRQLSR